MKYDRHGHSSNESEAFPLYQVWTSMKYRCSSNHDKNECWNGRGITVCDEWANSFMSFYNWSMNNGYKKGLTLDRKDNDGNYSPDNCRFTTWTIQNLNKRKPKRLPRDYQNYI